MIILTFRGLILLVGTRNTSVMVTNVGFLYLGIKQALLYETLSQKGDG